MRRGRPKAKLDGRKVKAWLDSEHRKSSYLSDKLKISQSLAEKMLGGKAPEVETLRRLARLMGCTIEDLLLPDEALAS